MLIMGDFNGRVGDLDDRYNEYMLLCQTIPTPKPDIDIPIRKSCDSVVNSHGNKIVQLCHTMDFVILNGRTVGDIIGNFTHHNNNNGLSTIDYGLCIPTFYGCVENFVVLPLTELSDHSKIITIFKSSILIPKLVEDTYKWNQLRPKFKWDNEKKEEFSKTLKNSVEEIEAIIQRIEGGLIKSTGEKIQKLFISAAKQTLQAKVPFPEKNWKKRKKSKKWFDKECVELKCYARKLGREKHKNPHDNLLKNKYHEKLREYKNKCKSKRYHFWQETVKEIESALNNPSTFWHKWKNASEIDVTPKCPNITGEGWYNHFSNLHKENHNSNEANLMTYPTR